MSEKTQGTIDVMAETITQIVKAAREANPDRVKALADTLLMGLDELKAEIARLEAPTGMQAKPYGFEA